MLVSGAQAFTIVPAQEDPSRIIVLIDRDYGDVVPVKALPPPFDQLVQTAQGPDTLSFRWRYYRSSEEGMCYVHVRPDGSGSVHFEFYGPELADGDTLGAAAVLVDAEGTAMASFLARADIVGSTFAEGGAFHHVRMEVGRPLDWWRKVDAIAFFTMKYYRVQSPGDAGIWEAMHTAVRRYTHGAGEELQSKGQ